MDTEESREIILKKLSPMKRMDILAKVFEIFNSNDNLCQEFLEFHLNKYEVNDPVKFVTELNDIIIRDTSMGIFFQDILKITSDKVGIGEVLFSLCIKDAISGGSEDTDIILPEKKSFEVKKITKGGIFSFSERFTEYNDLGLILNSAILNFSEFDIFKGKNLYTTSTKEIRTFKMLLEKFLLSSNGSIPIHRNQNIVKVNGEIKTIIYNKLISFSYKEEHKALYSMFNFRDQILLSKIKPITLELFKNKNRADIDTSNIINDLFSITPLKQILKDIEGIFLILPDHSISYLTPHENHTSLYNPRDIHLYDISRNKMNFKGPFLKTSRQEKTPGELPEVFQSL